MGHTVLLLNTARNIPLHRRGVFIYKNGEGSATFPPQGYQYVQRSYQNSFRVYTG